MGICNNIFTMYITRPDYSILKDYECYLPAMLTLMSSSNLADATDYLEDKMKNLNTIPVVFGKDIGYRFSLITILIRCIYCMNIQILV